MENRYYGTHYPFRCSGGGIEYVAVACATSSSSPSERICTSPTARRLPSLISLHSAIRSFRAGLRRKLMLRLVVTASGTGPTEASTATYIAKSVSPIIVGPEIVPPGRSDLSLNTRRTRDPQCQASSMILDDAGDTICANSRSSSSLT